MAPGEVTGRTRPTKVKKQQRALKRKRDDVDVDKLAQAVADLDTKTGSYKQFADLPLSEPTKAGLKASHFVDLTDIQAKAVPAALKGADILGAAKTGSGKTLAFIIPVLENLYRAQCVGPDAGLGAMIISPTRELAIQIFDVLFQVGKKGHMFAAGLIIGGKSLQEEQDALVRMNIVVCTPGRMLQHLSQTAAFSVDNLQMLVLDEADRIMDLGFQRDVDAIVEYLPKDRQTLLFSATQTRKVSDLARLSLKEPLYISVHEGAEKATPKKLQQNYIISPLNEKLDTLWSFIQSSKKAKIIVFLSSGKQVRFVFESFRKMQPGIPLLHLHGRQKQSARLEINRRFADAKYSCLFATDVAARGLDFPAIDWVVQVDCPEDADTYIHRVGRTARYQSEGRAVLFLDPSEEEGMLKRLEQKKVPIERINVKQKKKQTITNQMANLCFKDPALKYLGQKAFASYARSIHLQKDKEIFKLNKLPLEEYATSLGLPGAPRIKFMKGDNAKNLKNAPRQVLSSDDDSDLGSGAEDGAAQQAGKNKKKQDTVRTKYDRMFERQNQDVLSSHYSNIIQDEDLSGGNESNTDGSGAGADDFNGLESTDADAADDTFLSVKRVIPLDEDMPDTTIPDLRPKQLVHLDGASEPLLIDSKRAEKRLKSKKQLLRFKDRGERLVFDDDGVAHPLYEMEDEDDFKAKGVPEVQRKAFLEAEAERVREADIGDKAVAKEKKRAKKEKRKERERREVEEQDDEDNGDDNDGGRDLFANFVADAAGVVSGEEDEVEKEKLQKRPKKWFEDESSGDEQATGNQKRRKKHKTAAEAPETLEDLEALAAGFLDS